MKYLFVCAISLVTVTSCLSGQNTPTVIVPTSGIAPNGIGVTTSELLFSQPYCATATQPRGIYSITSLSSTGSPLSLSAVTSEIIPLAETSSCAENYFAISTGTGGFTPGAVYSLGWDANNTTADVYKNGSVFITGITGYAGHAGITFDTVGTFHNALIVTTTTNVFGYDSAGHLLFTYPVPSGNLFESSMVVPDTYSPCPGCLLITAESTTPGGTGSIYEVRPNGTTVTLVAHTPGAEPESIVYISSHLCTFDGTNFAYFDSVYATASQIFHQQSTTGQLLAWTTDQLGPYTGQLLIAFEGTPSQPGTIYAFNGTTFTPFATDLPPYQLEGGTLVQCPVATGCPATQGFWKNHAFPSNMFNAQGQVVIGGVTYTADQLHAILKTAPKGGDAALVLMHQLIAAIANIDAGAQIAGVSELGVNVNLAISEAETLLQYGLPQPGFPGSNPPGVVVPINFNKSSGNFVQSSTTLGGYFTTLADILNAYNSAVGLNCTEGSGLTTGPNITGKGNGK